jgi:hypothetical protein
VVTVLPEMNLAIRSAQRPVEAGSRQNPVLAVAGSARCISGER